ncbi:AI-2E family transporter [Pilimelia columellifera]|uniref:AI-2E family transporter n=1 Tax=Pilimelia columellifera subsp. columellifera TaxID=706583 RepID=A0ABN3NLG3_9ACTN
MADDEHEATAARAVAARVPHGLMVAALTAGSALLIAGCVLLVGWALARLAPVTVAVVAALLLAALLQPLTVRLERMRVPAGLAALTSVLVLLVVFLAPLILIGRQAAGQFGDLRRQLQQGLGEVRRMLLTGPFPISERQLDELSRQLGEAATATVPGLASGALVAAEALGTALLALVLLFFLLKDGPQMWAWLLDRAPRHRQQAFDRAATSGWEVLTGYIRGTVIIATVDALGIGLALVLLDVPLALPLALLTFTAAFVPILGATLAGAAAVLVALVANGPTDALLVLAATIAVQQTEGYLLEPLVMGKAVRLHPAVILIAIATGTVLAGIAGAVVAVPLTAATYRVAQTLRQHSGTG